MNDRTNLGILIGSAGLSVDVSNVVIEAAGGRNINFVISGGGSRFFVKRYRRSLIEFQSIFSRVHAISSVAQGVAVAPTWTDLESRTSIYPYIEGDTLSSALLLGNSEVRAEILTECLSALNVIHNAGSLASKLLPSNPPWITRLLLPTPSIMKHCSSSQLDVIRYIQSKPKIYNYMLHLQHSWTADVPIHADMRAENVLVSPHGIRLIDWEDAQMGDSDWDVGGIQSALLISWLQSVPPDVLRGSSGELGTAIKAKDMTKLTNICRSFARDIVRFEIMTIANLVKCAFEAGERNVEMSAAQLLILQVATNISLRGLGDFI